LGAGLCCAWTPTGDDTAMPAMRMIDLAIRIRTGGSRAHPAAVSPFIASA
jgi:hypothetical protein